MKFYLRYQIVNLYLLIILMLQSNLFFLQKDLKSLLQKKFFQFYPENMLLLKNY